MLLMKRSLGWRYPFYVRANVANQPRLRIGVDTLRVIQSHNQLDLELYEFARELFSAEMQLCGASFERELRLFKRLNYFYGHASSLGEAALFARSHGRAC